MPCPTKEDDTHTAPESETPLVTILIPCLNEATTIVACIEESQLALSDTNVTGEILVADNGSTDGSVDLARAAGARVVHVDRKGYGSALISGIRSARGKYILMGDADGSYVFSGFAQVSRPA